MENNFNESMNLGGMASSGYASAEPAVQPVFTTSTTGNTETMHIEMPSQPIGVTQNMHAQIVNAETTTFGVNNSNEYASQAPVSPVSPTAPVQETPAGQIIYDDATVPVSILKNLVSNARKVGTYDAIRTISQVVAVELGSFGIKVNASNKLNDYECIDDNVKYNVSLKFCVDIQDLGNLLNNLDCESVKLEVNDKILKITMPEGSEFLLAEKMDPQTQEPIDLDLVFPIKYEDMIEIDLEQLVNNIKCAKPIRELQQLDPEFAGIFFSNLVMSSDRYIIYVQDNQPILKTQNFFIGAEFCKLITELNFNKNKFRIGFTTDTNNDIRALTLSDGKLTVCGSVEPSSPINKDVCANLWNTKFAHKITMSTRKLSYAIKRLKQFNNKQQQDTANFEIAGNALKITLNTPIAKENLLVEDNDTNYTGTISLQLTRLETILATINSDKFTIAFDDAFDGCVALLGDDYKWIMSGMSD